MPSMVAQPPTKGLFCILIVIMDNAATFIPRFDGEIKECPVAVSPAVKVRLVLHAAERGVGSVGRIVEASPIIASPSTFGT